MNELLESLRAIGLVWLRHFAGFRKGLIYGLVTSISEPVFYFLSFGFGLGSLVETVEFGGELVSYKRFVFAGIVAQTALFQGFFESAYGSFIRMYYQKIFYAIATTPITLSEVLWAELLWGVSRSTFSCSVVLGMGCFFGAFDWSSAILALLFCVPATAIFSSLGLLSAARSRTIEGISYPQYLLIFPMFLFCGVFFPLSNVPEFFQLFAKLLPLTPVLEVLRGILLHQSFSGTSVLLVVGWLLFFGSISRRAMFQRLIH